MASSEDQKRYPVSGKEIRSMTDKQKSVKDRPVVDRDISREPAMKRLKELFEDMTEKEQERAGGYLRQKRSEDEN